MGVVRLGRHGVGCRGLSSAIGVGSPRDELERADDVEVVDAAGACVALG